MADPKTIGRYQVLRPIGQGGMGTVYLAEDPLLKRRVAIKVIRVAGSARHQAMLRFRREAETHLEQFVEQSRRGGPRIGRLAPRIFYPLNACVSSWARADPD